MYRARGFTLIELLIVMAIVATLLSLVAPRYFQSVEKARETVLRTNLKGMRDAIDKFRADTGRFPSSLSELVDRRYLRGLPIDPVTERSDTWVLIGAGCNTESTPCSGVADVRSGASGSARDGSIFAQW